MAQGAQDAIQAVSETEDHMSKNDDGGIGCLLFCGLIALAIGVAGYFGFAGILVMGIVFVGLACFVIWSEQGWRT